MEILIAIIIEFTENIDYYNEAGVRGTVRIAWVSVTQAATSGHLESQEAIVKVSKSKKFAQELLGNAGDKG